MTVSAMRSGLRGSPRSTAEIREQLADLVKVKASATAYGKPNFASQIAMQSILGHEQELVEELRAAELLESNNAAELVLGGDPVCQHTIHAAFLGTMLAKMQQLVNALAQAMTRISTARAPLPRNLVAENRLIVTGWTPSSFAVQLRLPTQEELGQFIDSESQTVLDDLSMMLGEQAASQQTIEWVSHPRVKKHYYELLDSVAKQGATVRFRTRGNPYGATVDTQQARDRVAWLDLLTVKEESLSLAGILVGGNIESGRFELKVEEETYRGRISESAKAAMRQITFGATVKAKVRVTTMIHEEGAAEPATSYYLDTIEQ